MPALYFLGNNLLARSEQFPWWSATTKGDCSFAYFCQRCGTQWARIATEYQNNWASINRTCERCAKFPHPVGCPGSFLHPWAQGPLNHPNEVLEYELLLRIRLLEQGLQYYDT